MSLGSTDSSSGSGGPAAGVGRPRRTAHPRARPTAVVLVALATLAIVLPATASASSISFSGGVLTYNAAAGEENSLNLVRGNDPADCGSRRAPCLVADESFSVAITSFPAAHCSREEGIADTHIECDVPASVVVNLGDGDDYLSDWDGPSLINGGAGNESALIGHGGNDTINGGAGSDALSGDQGNDTLDGGEGDDYLEGFGNELPTAGVMPTAGSDIYVGGPGRDLVDYGGRTEALSINLDDARNDGAPGEADSVGADVERVRGGLANDTLVGSAAANDLDGAGGNDTLRGGAGEDALLADDGDDRLFGEAGQDTLQGANGNDELDGGAGIDSFNGDGEGSCTSCGSGMDRILARDGLVEEVRCGAGEDTAILDAGDLTSQDCEHVERGDAAGGGSSGGGGSTTPAGSFPGALGAGAGAGLTQAQPAAPPRRKADPYAKCRKLTGKRKKACLRKVKALKRCSGLKGKQKKACVRKVTRRLSGTRRR